jgi:hypothetical protein
VIFTTNHPDQCRNNLWLLRRVGAEKMVEAPKIDATVSPGAKKSPRVKKQIGRPSGKKGVPSGTRFYAVLNKEDKYAQELLYPENLTHNAVVYRLLIKAGKVGLTMLELHDAAMKAGWQTTSPAPRSILAWHINHLIHERGLVEAQ